MSEVTTQNGCPDSIFSIYCARNQCECTGSLADDARVKFTFNRMSMCTTAGRRRRAIGFALRGRGVRESSLLDFVFSSTSVNKSAAAGYNLYRANDETRDEDDHPVAWFEQQSVATTHYISPTTHYISPSSEHTRIVVISADRFEDNLGTENRAEGRDTITRSANVGDESLRLILVLLG